MHRHRSISLDILCAAFICKSGATATKIKVHGVIIFNCWNHGSHKLQEYEKKQNEWCTKPVDTAHGVGNWRTIRRQWKEFSTHIRFKHGNGRRISFWNDNWLGHGPLRDAYPEIYSLTSHPEAKIMEVRVQNGWNFSFRRALNDWELGRMTEFLKILDDVGSFNESEDTMVWKTDGRIPFTVRSAYTSYGNQGQHGIEWPSWKQIWKTQVPYKVTCFSWLVTKRVCLTHENLQRRGVQLSSRCFLCNSHNEDNSHLFLHCPVTSHLWHLFLTLADLKWCMPRHTEDPLKAWSHMGGNIRHKKWWRAIPQCIWWTVGKKGMLDVLKTGAALSRK